MVDKSNMESALPNIPLNASGVPQLTSIHATPDRGPYGSPRFRGNCNGFLIRDLLAYFRPRHVLDPMTGSGTCTDVCQELKIPCRSLDLSAGFDACRPDAFAPFGTFDFVWLHPPYWNLIEYNADPRCLSAAATLGEFLSRIRTLLANSKQALTPRGRLAILMGDICRRGSYYALPFHVMQAAIDAGLELAAPEIIRFSHGASSTKKKYSTTFIPRLHDICLVLRPAGRAHVAAQPPSAAPSGMGGGEQRGGAGNRLCPQDTNRWSPHTTTSSRTNGFTKKVYNAAETVIASTLDPSSDSRTTTRIRALGVPLLRTIQLAPTISRLRVLPQPNARQECRHAH